MTEFELNLNLNTARLQLRSDTVAPIACYNTLRDQSSSVILESMEGSGRSSRYTVVASHPLLTFHHRNGISSLSGALLSEPVKSEGNPFDHLQILLKSIQFDEDEAFLTGFLAGYIGFESFSYIEPTVTFPEATEGDPPDILLILPSKVLRFDNFKHTVDILVHGKKSAGELDADLEALVEELGRSRTNLVPPGLGDADPDSELTAMSEPEFAPLVKNGQEHIHAGDIFQVVLSRSKSLQAELDALEIYREVRRINPSPYMYLLELPEISILGASPETMVKCVGQTVSMRPIAGTRRRGRTAQEEEALGQELLNDEKELAEHDMLVDLGRNDVGRVATIGSVEVVEYRKLEYFSHVMHIVSTVEGEKRPELDAVDVFKACFPAGTVSGAPKIRAVEIINDLEATRRGPYAGAIGYFDFAGNSDTCIAIRTLVSQGDQHRWQAGAGVVADSVPALEFKETENKGRVFKQILTGVE